MISKEEVQHIAKLARLELTEKEIEKMQKDLSGILDYFEVLKKAPKLSAKNEAAFAKASASQSREDKVIERPASLAGDLVQLAPEKKDGYVKVKQIL